MIDNKSYIFNIRDILFGVCDNLGGILCFDSVPKRTMLQAVEKIPDNDLDSHYNSAPTIRELINLVDVYQYGGYIILPPRGDARIVIDSLYIPDYADQGTVIRFQEIADEYHVISKNNMKFWYFRWK